ncbi:MAG TPA: hypothetical protein VGI78_09115 [Acetobacteraceae bacterium]
MTPNEMFPRSTALLRREIAKADVPQRMRTRPRDARGYPIPFLVMIDRNGTPQFTINDDAKAAACRAKRLCAICGKRFDPDGVWFVGGSRCFLHEHGAFIDPPSHLECATYSLRVCPFLAASRYMRRIDDAKLAPGAMPDDKVLVRTEAVAPRLPERFGLGRTSRYRFEGPHFGCFVVEQWDYVEWWRAGAPCETPDTGEPVAIEEMLT